jgi:hypothetical protein
MPFACIYHEGGSVLNTGLVSGFVAELILIITPKQLLSFKCMAISEIQPLDE